MKITKNKSAMKVGIAGAIIVALIMILGTILVGRFASRDTETAVRNVSLLYLDELAGRREQVLSSTLTDYIRDLDVALGLMEPDDLAGITNLQKYQVRMKQLYNLEKFAFVDEDGLIYTSRGTRTDIDQYDVDLQNIHSPEISIKNADKDDKKVIVAVPVDRLPLEGKTLVACFMEIDMEQMLQNISLQSGDNNTTFCNLYNSYGESLTNSVLAGNARVSNLLTALNYARFDPGYSYDKTKDDFANGEKGVVSFTYNGVKETLYYVPVRRTDWMLTYLIRESVISEQIDAISDGIIFRSLIQSILTAAVLLSIFIFVIIQMRKASAMALEQETSERMQQELEERIALQDELLEQEKARAEQDSMITALAADYRSVYYIDLETRDCICYRNDNTEDNISAGDRFNFDKAFEDYARDYVEESYRQGFLDFIRTDNIRKALSEEQIIVYRYMVVKNGVESYEMLRMADVDITGEEDKDETHVVKAIGAGFTDIDAQMRDAMAKSQALSDALDAAEEASKAKTVFLSNMSHEIRTPMNAIIGLDSLALNEEGISESTRDYLEKIGDSAKHLLYLINDILDMSRIEAGRMTLKNEEFSFSRFMEQINVMIGGQCKEKGLSYECHIAGDISDHYIGDSTKLRQVLINILGNAVKFTPVEGRVDFFVEKVADFQDKSTLKFTISDTGVGMSRDYLPKLFETFSQEESGAANSYGSSGLGMAITKNIVDMMNGKIEVESEKGKGTTFEVMVTLLDSKRQLTGEDGEIDIELQGLCVLVIDDDPVACDHAKLILEKEGGSVDTAHSGADAIEMIKVRRARMEPYNLIIVDWQMPEMDGVETTRRIREMIGDESAIIILTAYNWDDVSEEAIEAGVDSFIAKPLFVSNLLEEFQSALKKKKIRTSEEVHRAKLEGRRILLAEDMSINAQIMIEVLKMRGITAELAENGRIAVEMFASHESGYYDAILMDMRMPEMDGLTATEKIREMDREDAATIPIIALTANAFDEDVQKSLQVGMNAHLAKPVEPELLFETLEFSIRE